MKRTIPETQELLIASTLRVYASYDERVALRCALGDAVALCDALNDKIKEDNTTRGRVTNDGTALAAVAKRAGDLIWQMREMIDPRATNGRSQLKEQSPSLPDSKP